MIGNLYNNKSDERYLNKDIESLGNIELYFKDETELVNPTLKISTSDISKNANYIYLSDLKRYYYIRNKRYGKQCIYLDCEVDVLMSHREEIKNLEAIIARNENKYNLYLNDDNIKTLQYEIVRTISFPSGFDKTAQNFLLCVTGGIETDSGGGE